MSSPSPEIHSRSYDATILILHLALTYIVLPAAYRRRTVSISSNCHRQFCLLFRVDCIPLPFHRVKYRSQRVGRTSLVVWLFPCANYVCEIDLNFEPFEAPQLFLFSMRYFAYCCPLLAGFVITAHFSRCLPSMRLNSSG